eukprot:CAMPEP_0201122274 /NCGR_PEP_ID=MMETSP0850-20130426/5953_1 /ASSEMBLY_ACC=CAM_ASM_000622 /TAXON_ID=183588 /ORGANISM="Pseudo-nitzschia fraudulenta, Strain WWA7" /LENGTH=313 /DNA_ID=CAMNT_0047388933 /DNA_START=166 /DNA_END=1108 /DNA_ORIENTATION=+
MPSIRKPHNNRMSTSDSLRTHDIWSKTIGHDPYANAAEEAATGDAANAMANATAAAEKVKNVMQMARTQNVTDGADRHGFTAKLYLGLKRGKVRRSDNGDPSNKANNHGVDPKLRELLDDPDSSSEEEFVEEEELDQPANDEHDGGGDESEEKRKKRSERKDSGRKRKKKRKSKRRRRSDSSSSDESSDDSGSDDDDSSREDDGSEIENEEGGRSESTDRRQNADTNEAGKIRRLLAEDAGARRRTAAATISPGNDGNGERNDAVERKSPSRLAERANQAAGATAKTPIGIPRATTKAKGVMTRGSTDAILHG